MSRGTSAAEAGGVPGGAARRRGVDPDDDAADLPGGRPHRARRPAGRRLAAPRGRRPASATIHVLCANPDKGPNVRKVCGVGCIGCHLCEKNSGGKEANHFTFNGFLAKVNYENPPTDEQIVAKCPAGCMSVDPHFETAR